MAVIEVILIAITIGILALAITAYSKEKLDYLSTSILGCVGIVLLVVIQEEHTDFNFFDTIDFETILYIFGMQVVVIIGEQEHVFEWVAIKLIRATKGSQRKFFYLILILGIILTGFVGDLAVCLIFTPLIIKTCRILEIPAGTYSLGLVMSLRMGTLITPYSCPENFIASIKLNLSPTFFLTYLAPLAVFLTIVTLLLFDIFILRKEESVRPERKLLLLELLDASVVIENKKRFYVAAIGTVVMFVCMFVFPQVPTFLIVFTFGFSMVLGTRRKMKNLFREVDWSLIFFFISLFILIGVLDELGFMSAIGDGIAMVSGGNIVVASVFIYIFAVVLASPLANAPIILFFLPLIQVLEINGLVLAPLGVALILGTNIGGTFLPQGTPVEMVSLEICRKFNVPNLNFRRLLRTGASFAVVDFGISFLYVIIFSLFFL